MLSAAPNERALLGCLLARLATLDADVLVRAPSPGGGGGVTDDNGDNESNNNSDNDSDIH